MIEPCFVVIVVAASNVLFNPSTRTVTFGALALATAAGAAPAASVHASTAALEANNCLRFMRATLSTRDYWLFGRSGSPG